MQNTYLY